MSSPISRFANKLVPILFVFNIGVSDALSCDIEEFLFGLAPTGSGNIEGLCEKREYSKDLSGVRSKKDFKVYRREIYSREGKLLEVWLNGALAERFVYDSSGVLIGLERSMGSKPFTKDSYSYDGLRLDEIQTLYYDKTREDYVFDGKATFNNIDTNGSHIKRRYNRLGNLIEETRCRFDGQGRRLSKESVFFDQATGEPVSDEKDELVYTDQLGPSSRKLKDKFGILMDFEFAYNDEGCLTKLGISVNGVAYSETVYEYDSHSFVMRESGFLGGVLSETREYEYDAQGRMSGQQVSKIKKGELLMDRVYRYEYIECPDTCLMVD